MKLLTTYYESYAGVRAFHAEELVATKIRALYQRSKGRDLFDLWLALEVLALEPKKIIEAFALYRPVNLTSSLAIKNLKDKLDNKRFLEDLNGLVITSDIAYDPRIAGTVVAGKLLSLL